MLKIRINSSKDSWEDEIAVNKSILLSKDF